MGIGMTVTIEIPAASEAQFLKVFGPDLSRAATEALLINGYRTGRISLGFVAELLGLDTRLQAQQWLSERGVPLNYDLQELEADRETLRKNFNVSI
jgi:predicted HTH domain antitoxin